MRLCSKYSPLNSWSIVHLCYGCSKSQSDEKLSATSLAAMKRYSLARVGQRLYCERVRTPAHRTLHASDGSRHLQSEAAQESPAAKCQQERTLLPRALAHWRQRFRRTGLQT